MRDIVVVDDPEIRLRNLAASEPLPHQRLVSRGEGGVGLVGEEPELGSCDCRDQHSGIVCSDHTVQGDDVAQAGYRLGRPLRVRTVDLHEAITHFEWRRLLGGNHQVDSERLCGSHEVTRSIGCAG